MHCKKCGNLFNAHSSVRQLSSWFRRCCHDHFHFIVIYLERFCWFSPQCLLFNHNDEWKSSNEIMCTRDKFVLVAKESNAFRRRSCFRALLFCDSRIGQTQMAKAPFHNFVPKTETPHETSTSTFPPLVIRHLWKGGQAMLLLCIHLVLLSTM